jgi:ethanolamine ammonia-lyase small subunit
VVLVVSNGLSSLAIERHGAGLVAAIVARLTPLSLRLGPVVLVPDGRVALGDDVGEALGARLSIVLVGERPGLSSADGIGIYMTYAPAVGTTDERRNCISNVRTPGGLPYEAAAAKLAWLVEQSLFRQLSGVALKDEAPALVLGSGAEPALLP